MTRFDPETIAALELRSVPAGLVVLDALAKAASVDVRFASDIDPGRWLVIFDGPQGEVEASLAKAVEVAADDLLQSLLLPAAHRGLRAALRGELARPERAAASEASLGALECHTVLATLAATDRALKAADVELLRLRLATHLGGGGHAIVAGEQADVEAALAAASDGAEAGTSVLVRCVPRAAPETVAAAAQRPAHGRTLRPLEG